MRFPSLHLMGALQGGQHVRTKIHELVHASLLPPRLHSRIRAAHEVEPAATGLLEGPGSGVGHRCVIGVAGADRRLARPAGREGLAQIVHRSGCLVDLRHEPARLEQMGGEPNPRGELVVPPERAQEHARSFAGAGQDGVAACAQLLEFLAQAMRQDRAHGRDPPEAARISAPAAGAGVPRSTNSDTPVTITLRLAMAARRLAQLAATRSCG